jgi:integrase
MATIELRKDKSGNLIAYRTKVRRKGQSDITKTFPVRGPRAADRNTAKREAESWANSTESEVLQGTFICMKVASTTTLGASLERYAKTVSTQKKGGYQEQSKIRVILQHPIAKMNMSNVRASDVAQYRDDRLGVVSGGTVLREMALLSHLFSHAQSEWNMEGLTNPVTRVKKPSPGRSRTRRAMTGELEAIIEHAQGHSLKAQILLFVETAMRRSEMTSVRWEHVFLDQKFARLVDSKNGEMRDIPLSKLAISILSKIQRDSGCVFQMRADSITQAFSRAKKRARANYESECGKTGIHPDPKYLVDLRVHDLRHEAASVFFEKGLNVIEVATVTGHKDLRMLKRYTHLKAHDIAVKLG